jgi:isoamylase
MTLSEALCRQPVQWHGVKLNEPDWGYESHTLAATVPLFGYQFLMHLIVNAYWEPLDFELPPLGSREEAWRRCVDTYLDPPHDICDWSEAPELQGATCRVQPRSIVMLLGRSRPG